MSQADDRFAIIRVLDRYAEILDARDWDALSEVFTPNVEMDFVSWRATDLEGVRSQIRRLIVNPSRFSGGSERALASEPLRGRQA